MQRGVRSIGASLLIVVGMVVAACGTGASSNAPTRTNSPTGGATTPAASSTAGEVPGPLADQLTVRFGVFPNITHAPGLVALADGGTLSELLPNASV